MEIKKYLKLIILILVLLFFILFIFKSKINLFKKRSEDIIFTSDTSQEEEKEKILIVVDISGAINNPGVYTVEDGSILNDLITLSGGFSPDADLSFISQNINLSALILNHQKIYIPKKGETIISDVYNNISDQQARLISINNASLAELDSLPGIGPSTAQKIIDGRPYKSIDDLKNVSGIGESKFNKIKDKICL